MFCYADDLVLTSLSVTGLQDLINSAKSFIVSHGLNFNPSKTVCTTFGNTVFERTPSWTLDRIALKEETSVTYLGTTMSDNPTNHIKARIYQQLEEHFTDYRVLGYAQVEWHLIQLLITIMLQSNQF